VPYSILHLSDLHRSPEDSIGNDELLSTLQADIDRWPREDPEIAPPDAIIITGDLVRGVALGSSNPDAELQRQYEQALDFLERLTAQILAGHRDRVVFVPGNHDVDWNRARAAMELVDDGDIGFDLRPASFAPDTDLRWNWADRRVYRIVDRETYETRFDRYWDLYDQFHGTTTTRPAPYHTLFELSGGRIGGAAFNSCHGNDCYAFHGAIPEPSVASAHLALRNRGHELLIGVWHHSVEGTPFATDYMDISTVYRLIGKGFRLGLHGHQHRAQTGHRYIHLPEQQPIALVSSGSLCAGARELPPGVNRQYNVLMLSDDLAGGRVHIREMAVSTIFAAARRPEFGGSSFVDLAWGPIDAESALRARHTALVIDAETAINTGDYVAALAALDSLDKPLDAYANDLVIEALRRGGLWDQIRQRFPTPASVPELVLAVGAALQLRDWTHAEDLLDHFAQDLGLPSVEEGALRARLTAMRSLSQ
jgi:hypothetical protein